jgi:hypothetical protein
MSKFARVNGDLLPVLNDDTGSYVNSGPNAVQSGATVQPQGPALAFFTVTGDGPLTGTQVTYAIRAAEQLATVHIYEFVQDGNGILAIALYPIDAWVATSMEPGKGLQEQIRDALTAAGQPNDVTVAGGAFFSETTYPPTGPIAPAAPVIGTAVATSATAASVQFTPQYNGGSAITGYTVTSVPGALTGTGLTSPIAVTGLTTGTSYKFFAVATNAVGTSVPSDPSNTITTP